MKKNLSLRLRGQKLQDAIDKLAECLDEHEDLLDEKGVLSELDLILETLREANE